MNSRERDPAPASDETLLLSGSSDFELVPEGDDWTLPEFDEEVPQPEVWRSVEECVVVYKKYLQNWQKKLCFACEGVVEGVELRLWK